MRLLTNKYAIYNDDCLIRLPLLEPNSIDSIVSDPPYGLASIVSRFKNTSTEDDNITGERCKTGSDGFGRLAKGFMGKEWDSDIAFQVNTWRKCYDVIKPGGYLLAFGGTRTFHRMVIAIEDAGFEIRDQLMWLYGTGFPKSHNLGDGQGTALKPCFEPICLARKPLEGTNLENKEKYGTAGLNIDACRVPKETDDRFDYGLNELDKPKENKIFGKYNKVNEYVPHEAGRWPGNVIHDDSDEVNGALKLYSNNAYRFFYSAKADETDRTCGQTANSYFTLKSDTPSNIIDEISKLLNNNS